MSKQSRFPLYLILGGALVGGTIGWWFGWFGFLPGAHLAIVLGVWMEPSRRRLGLAGLAMFLIWWPFWLGQWLWE